MNACNYQKTTNNAGESISIIASTMSVIFGIVGAFGKFPGTVVAVIKKGQLKRQRYLRAAEIKQQGYMSTAMIFSVIEGSWDAEPVTQASNDLEFGMNCVDELSYCNDRVFHEKKKRDGVETTESGVCRQRVM